MQKGQAPCGCMHRIVYEFMPAQRGSLCAVAFWGSRREELELEEMVECRMEYIDAMLKLLYESGCRV